MGGGEEEEEEEEEEEVLALTGRGGGGGGGRGVGGLEMGGASVFHTNLRVLVGEQPRIVEEARPVRREVDREAVGKASGWGGGLRYKRCWQEAIASLFVSSPEARVRLAKTFYK